MGYKVYTKGFEDLELQISDYGKRVTPLMKRAVYAGAGQIANNVRTNLNSAVSSKATGELADCININKIVAKNGVAYTSVGFDGYIGPYNAPAPLVAAVLDSGRSDQPGRKKTHFFSRAVKAARISALEAMQTEVYRYLDELNNK